MRWLWLLFIWFSVVDVTFIQTLLCNPVQLVLVLLTFQLAQLFVCFLYVFQRTFHLVGYVSHYVVEVLCLWVVPNNKVRFPVTNHYLVLLPYCHTFSKV